MKDQMQTVYEGVSIDFEKLTITVGSEVKEFDSDLLFIDAIADATGTCPVLVAPFSRPCEMFERGACDGTAEAHRYAHAPLMAQLAVAEILGQKLSAVEMLS